MKLSLSVNLPDILSQKRNAKIFHLFRKTSLDGIELVVSGNIKEKELEILKGILDEHKISVLSLHQPMLTIYRIGFEKIQKLFEEAKYLAAKLIVLHIFSLGNKIYDGCFISALKSLEEKYGVKIGLENGTTKMIIGLKHHCYRQKDFSETVEKSGLGITFDITHLAQATGGDIAAFYKKNKERILNIHLSDYKYGWLPRNPLGVHMALGKGNLPIEDFLTALKEDHYGGFLTFEINDSIEEIKKSIEFAQRVLICLP